MDSETPTQIPVFDFTSDTQTLKPGTDAWNKMSGDVCAALARLGCFQVAYDGVPNRLREDMFEVMERVFDLPAAWSNGRIPAVKHRVVLSPGKERYSFGLFMLPKQDMAVEELVDEAHPPRYKAFDYMDYLRYMEAHLLKMLGSNKGMVNVFAGV